MTTPDTPDAAAPAALPIAARMPRSWPVLLLAAPAFVAIWSGWVGLGTLTGFGEVRPLPGIWDAARIDTAITLPIGVETYAAYALHVWLSRQVDARAARFAKWSALGSLILGAAGQVAYHLMVAAGMTAAPWQITALVACLPVAVLGMGAALAHLVAHTDPQPEPQAHGQADDQGDDQADDRSDGESRDQGDDQGDEKPEEKPKAKPRGRASTAARVARLRRQHPGWTVGQIAQRAGVTERTARRYLNADRPAATDDGDARPAADAA